MSIWDKEELTIKQRKRRNGRKARENFGIVKRTGGVKQGLLYVPRVAGGESGDKVRFLLLEDGVALRFGTEGEYTLHRPNESGSTLWVSLPEVLWQYAGPVVQDVEAVPFEGGWFIPFDQFEGGQEA